MALEMLPLSSSSLYGWGRQGTQQVKNYSRMTRSGWVGWQDEEHWSGLGLSSVLMLAEGTEVSHFLLSKPQFPQL